MYYGYSLFSFSSTDSDEIWFSKMERKIRFYYKSKRKSSFLLNRFLYYFLFVFDK